MVNLEEVIDVRNVFKKEGMSDFACFDSVAYRLKSEDRKGETNIRTEFSRDADRIIHSKAYSRYMDKTQVFPICSNDMITHRGLHVQFVAKISRTICRVLGLNEDLAEAIGLGHDLGHVPFGHYGERVLNEISLQNNMGYFLHNVQSVRLLETFENNGKGINISLQVLDGILCHNGEMLEKRYVPDYDKTKEQFLEEYKNCWLKKGFEKSIRAMTLEGCVVRISDVIAYIGRDLEDAIVLGYLKREDIPNDITKVLGNTNSQIIDVLVNDLLVNSYEKPYLEFSEDVFSALKKLMDFNYKNIYQNPKKASTEEKSKLMFNMLFNKYLDDLNNKKGFIYNNHYLEMCEEYRNETSNARVVLDFIAGMTDNYFLDQFVENFIPKKT